MAESQDYPMHLNKEGEPSYLVVHNQEEYDAAIADGWQFEPLEESDEQKKRREEDQEKREQRAKEDAERESDDERQIREANELAKAQARGVPNPTVGSPHSFQQGRSAEDRQAAEDAEKKPPSRHFQQGRSALDKATGEGEGQFGSTPRTET